MKNINFSIKTLSLVFISGVLIVFSLITSNREKQLNEYQSMVAEIEAHNAEVLDLRSGSSNKYMDGIYEGSAHGFRGDIVVRVTIESGRISEIKVVSADKDDRAYVERAGAMTERIVSAQSTEVDVVSGATYSSNGIKNAVIEALKGAEG